MVSGFIMRSFGCLIVAAGNSGAGTAEEAGVVRPKLIELEDYFASIRAKNWGYLWPLGPSGSAGPEVVHREQRRKRKKSCESPPSTLCSLPHTR